MTLSETASISRLIGLLRVTEYSAYPPAMMGKTNQRNSPKLRPNSSSTVVTAVTVANSTSTTAVENRCFFFGSRCGITVFTVELFFSNTGDGGLFTSLYGLKIAKLVLLCFQIAIRFKSISLTILSRSYVALRKIPERKEYSSSWEYIFAPVFIRCSDHLFLNSEFF